MANNDYCNAFSLSKIQWLGRSEQAVNIQCFNRSHGIMLALRLEPSTPERTERPLAAPRCQVPRTRAVKRQSRLTARVLGRASAARSEASTAGLTLAAPDGGSKMATSPALPTTNKAA